MRTAEVISHLPLQAHLDYAKRVGSAQHPESAKTVASVGEDYLAGHTVAPVVVDAQLSHYLSAGRPGTIAVMPSEPAPHLVANTALTPQSLCFRVKPTKLWNILPKGKRVNFLACLSNLRQIKNEWLAIWKGRHEMLGE